MREIGRGAQRRTRVRASSADGSRRSARIRSTPRSSSAVTAARHWRDGKRGARAQRRRDRRARARARPDSTLVGRIAPSRSARARGCGDERRASASASATAAMIGCAPSRSSSFDPALCGDVDRARAPRRRRDPSSSACVGGDQRAAPHAAPRRRSSARASAAMMRLRCGNEPPSRSRAGRQLGEHKPALADLAMQRAVRARIRDVDAGAEHRDGAAADVERRAVRHAVDAERHAADDVTRRRARARRRSRASLARRSASRAACRRSRRRRRAARSSAPIARAPAADRAARAALPDTRRRRSRRAAARATRALTCDRRAAYASRARSTANVGIQRLRGGAKSLQSVAVTRPRRSRDERQRERRATLVRGATDVVRLTLAFFMSSSCATTRRAAARAPCGRRR